jgi:hypothetical protein
MSRAHLTLNSLLTVLSCRVRITAQQPVPPAGGDPAPGIAQPAGRGKGQTGR